MSNIMGNISNTDHIVQEPMLLGTSEVDLYGMIAKLVNRVARIERNIAVIEGKLAIMGENQRNLYKYPDNNFDFQEVIPP